MVIAQLAMEMGFSYLDHQGFSLILLSTSDKYMQVTLAFNHFGKELIQNMPRCRWGYFHVVNNDYTHWKLYAIRGSMHPTIISQGNRFIAPDNPLVKDITHRNYAPESEWRNWISQRPLHSYWNVERLYYLE
ncbi:hypothetical protein Goklo_029282, partial [Gossypium klotzschianum]|nr:hypothetical protein [Gossypium klotzschianum]